MRKPLAKSRPVPLGVNVGDVDALAQPQRTRRSLGIDLGADRRNWGTPDAWADLPRPRPSRPVSPSQARRQSQRSGGSRPGRPGASAAADLEALAPQAQAARWPGRESVDDRHSALEGALELPRLLPQISASQGGRVVW